MERKVRVSKLILLICLLFASFSALLVIAPILLPSGSVLDLSGMTGVTDNAGCVEEMPFPFSWVYHSGDRLCHQRLDRSFVLNGNQLPFCSRCTAIWIGITIGLAVMIFFKVALDERFLFLVILSLVPIGVDGIGQLVGFWESTNAIRLLTGLFVGVMTGIAIGVIIDEILPLLKKRKVHNL